MRKVLYVSGTRADYGLMKDVLYEIQNHKGLALEVVATGMHLMPEFGNTVEGIKKDGFKPHIIEAVHSKDEKASMSVFLGELVQKLTKLVGELKPDIIMVLGDRPEMLAAAIVGTYMSIPVAHLHGGEISSTVDEHVRHAITKLAHLHLPATEKSAKRIEGMNEEAWRIQVVGAPGVSKLADEPRYAKEELKEMFGLDSGKPLVLVLQHPVTVHVDEAGAEIEKTLKAVLQKDVQVIVIYPNADAGGRAMISKIEKYADDKKVKAYKSIERKAFLSLMGVASALVGNSSAGIIESASLGLPVINIGTRQQGRERPENVIDCGGEEKEIALALENALTEDFKGMAEKCKNPYYRENTPARVAEALVSAKITDKLLQKQAR